MNKRLITTHKPAAPATPTRAVRLARPRPNRYHSFLKRLHAGGRSNMYGAIPYLMDAFELDRAEAFRIVCEWVDQRRSEVGPPRAPASAVR